MAAKTGIVMLKKGGKMAAHLTAKLRKCFRKCFRKCLRKCIQSRSGKRRRRNKIPSSLNHQKKKRALKTLSVKQTNLSVAQARRKKKRRRA